MNRMPAIRVSIRPLTWTLVLLAGLMLCRLLFAQDEIKGTPLTAHDLQSMLKKGALLDTHHPTAGWKGSMMLTSIGLATVQQLNLNMGTGVPDTGAWRIKDDMLCIKWKYYREGDEICTRHYQIGDNQFEARLVGDGRLVYAYSLRN